MKNNHRYLLLHTTLKIDEFIIHRIKKRIESNTDKN